MMDSKELFDRLKRELDKRARRKEREERKEEEEDMSMTDESSTSSVEASSPGVNRDQRQSSAARKRKPHSGSSRTSRKIIDSSSNLRRSLSSSLYSSMQLPTACLNEHDGCDEAELIARAKRCKEILKLSRKAKEAKSARVKAAENKSLIMWVKPKFELDPTPPDTTLRNDASIISGKCGAIAADVRYHLENNHNS